MELTSLRVEASQIVFDFSVVFNIASSILIQNLVALISNKSSSLTIPILAFDKKFV
jgi:hypothetical protein